MNDATLNSWSRLALGTAQFGFDYGVTNTSGKVSPTDVARILDSARKLGVNTLDTASGYGDSEQVLGTAGVGDFRIITKLPSMPKGLSIDAGWVVEQARKSASKLGGHQVSALLVHNPADLSGPNSKELIRGLYECRDLGITQKIGVSIYDPADLAWISKLIRLDIVQSPMNVFDRRIVNSGWLERLDEEEVEIHIRSVFLQGTLLAGVAALPDFLRPWIGKFKEFESWAKFEGLTLLEAALLYPLSIQAVDKILIGVVSVDQLNDAVDATGRNYPSFPDFRTDDQQLINPVNWSK